MDDREEAATHGHQIQPGDEAGWGGLLVLAESAATARQWAEDMLWFWDSWSKPFGQDYPELLIGDPDTVARRIEEAARAVPINECFLLIPQGIHEGPRLAIRWTKVAVNKLLRASVNLVLDASLALEAQTFRTEDHREAMRAFVEKRPPRFVGR